MGASIMNFHVNSRIFEKVLIANRGEIACRIMRTCRRLDVRTVAVYSEADADGMHVRLADEAVFLGGSVAQESYLSIEKILAAAVKTGAQAIHPGYGFLSENEDFAEACTQAGIVFIGPPANAIRAMGSKSAAKALMQQTGVPLTPGYHGDNQFPEFLFEQAEAIGYPVLIKASAGGGGKGMRRVDEAQEFLSLLAACKREAASAFGDDRVLLEKYIVQPRHIEIQVFADNFGNTVSLFERDCSVQRRHQKVLEEAPAPGMTEERRAAMGRAACNAARAVGYVGAGTVEFIANPRGDFHFMEMNTRLQVEHPVTEMITGLDLVEWQLRIAAGETLPLKQDDLKIRGHAIEARIYAEDPSNGFLPSTGRLVHLKLPAATEHVRIDAGVEQNDEISSFYDPMIAKLIVWDDTRERALERMSDALLGLQIVGVASNVDFLKRLVTSASFSSANLDTSLIDRERQWLQNEGEETSEMGLLLAAFAALMGEAEEQAGSRRSYSPWALQDGWRLGGSFRRMLQFRSKHGASGVAVEYNGPEYRMRVGPKKYTVTGKLRSDGEVTATINGTRMHATVIKAQGSFHVFAAGQHQVYAMLDPLAFQTETGTAESSLMAPIPGMLTALLVQPGKQVEKETPLLILEAMKMEYTITAPTAGRVRCFFFAVGDKVSEGTQLLEFDRETKIEGE